MLQITFQTKGDGGNDQDDWAFTPTSRLPDSERFRGVEPLRMTCRSCQEQADFQGVFAWDRKKPVNGPGDIRVSSLSRPVAFTVFIGPQNVPDKAWKILRFVKVAVSSDGLGWWSYLHEVFIDDFLYSSSLKVEL